ncbi:glycosyltransferase [Microbacteriaceae bacterium]|nr:glycosyltransferase [Candidatus Saccharibacteria bacterium]
MQTNTPAKSVLIISYGPVPTPDNQTVEGGGMRAWGLAQGLKEHGVKTTIGINAGFPQKLTEHEGVKLINWELDGAFVQLINSFDAVIISYCMGDPSVFVADHINENVQLILDAYVPIYIEVSARDSKDIETEYSNYMADIQRHNHVLKRGDYFLYANNSQEQLYSGVLSALGIINPRSYREKRLIRTPFGVHRTSIRSATNPYTQLGVEKDDFTVLWFGGIYPWFRIEEYLDAIKLLAADSRMKFVFVGGKNPFNPNPDFSRQYDATVGFAKKHKLIDTQMLFVDWVDFDNRVNWFRHADVIVSLNQPGEENKYSWRTRVMDYVWGESVTVTNGGDPLSDEMISNKAALKLDELTSACLANTIKELKDQPSLLKDIEANVKNLKKKYFWDVVTAELAQTITDGRLPYADEGKLRERTETALSQSAKQSAVQRGRMSSLTALPIKIVRKVHQKGVIRTVKIANNVVKIQAKRLLTSKGRQSQFVFISHPINNTGAPIVLLQIVEEFVAKYGAARVRVIAPGIEAEQQAYLRKLGVSVEHMVFGANFQFIRLQLNLQPNDFVLMNTVAIYEAYRDFILLWLKNGRLKHAYWFIHEDQAQLPIVSPQLLEGRTINAIATLVKNGKLDILSPSRRTADEYNELLKVKQVRAINLHVEVPKNYINERTVADFDAINFLLSGTASDGRKGHMLILSAFQYFSEHYQAKEPGVYRPFTLHLVGVAHSDYLSQQIRAVSNTALNGVVKVYDPLPKADALRITHECNVVVCCSLNETFGLYIAEGMMMGHVVIRNKSAGVDEQLEDGKNGYLINHLDIVDVAQKIEYILNRSTPNGALQSMGAHSQAMMKEYSKGNYLEQIIQNARDDG